MKSMKLAVTIAAVAAMLLIAGSSVQAQNWTDISSVYGFGGQGWNAGYWNGSYLAPGDYTKNGLAWGAIGTSDVGIGAGLGYNGGGVGIKLPGQSPIKLGW